MSCLILKAFVCTLAHVCRHRDTHTHTPIPPDYSLHRVSEVADAVPAACRRLSYGPAEHTLRDSTSMSHGCLKRGFLRSSHWIYLWPSFLPLDSGSSERAYIAFKMYLFSLTVSFFPKPVITAMLLTSPGQYGCVWLFPRD